MKLLFHADKSMIHINKLISWRTVIATGPKLDEPLCFTAEEAGATISFNKVGNPDEAIIVTSTNGKTWTPYTFNTVVTLANVGDKVYFRAEDENDISFYKDSNNYYRFATIDEKKIAASGNIQTLMKAEGDRLDISGKTNCYRELFYGNKGLVAAPKLPATILASYCYTSMFQDCTSLTDIPALRATILASYCY